MVFAQSLLRNAKINVMANSENRENNLNVQNNDNIENNNENVEKNNTNCWTIEETMALINAYEHFSDMLSHAKKRKHVWEIIANEVVSLGVSKSAEKCEVKWRNLIRTYKAIKDNKKTTGRGAIRFQFYDKMDEILGEKPTMSCTHTIDSSSLDNTSDSINSSTSSKF